RLPQPKAPVRGAGPGVKQAIAAAERRGTITAAEAKSYRRAFRQAERVRGRISSYRSELSAQIAVLKGIAARGSLSGGRMPALFLQLRRNTEFFGANPTFPPRPDITREPCDPPPSSTSSKAGARIVFPGSKIVFQYYPGAALQLQPLANFGLANGLITQCRRDPAACDRDGLRQLLSELIAIRSSRGGFITWEYWFYFGGGSPPWTSAMSQGTAIQALTRASEPSILDDKSYLKVAGTALGAFAKRAPVGVRAPTSHGAHYLLYSFDPGLRVLNGFLQSITGLYDYARIAQSKTAHALFHDGNREARSELHSFDTGSWSLYSLGGAEATGGYHALVTGFLRNLCQRVKGRYCTYYKRFKGYATTPPALVYTGAGSTRPGHALAISYRTNKPTCVIAKVLSPGGQTAYRAQLKVARGAHSFSWVPHRRGRFTLELTGLDPLKNKKVVKRSIRVG
ncbi:MAG: hypothetical protein QOG63_121, partial [Thermoleophilaceae bacterium]|nr:hypothetical protein [Thermoleophilaceae bacterium]